MSVEHLRTLTARQAAAELAGDEDGAWDTGAVHYGLDTFRTVYRTVDPHGRPTTASGLLALPRSGERRLRAVSFTHGTELFKGDVASVSAEVWDQAPALTYASAGFAAVLPDHLGMGLGPGPQAWMDVPSETTAALDMLRASRTVATRQGRELRRGVLATGFSQGASAALGLARSLQEGADHWFRIRAIAPVSGAYAFRDAALPALLAGRTDPKASVICTALFLVAFNRLHHLYDTPARAFRAPYDRTIEGLLDGTHTGQEVVAGTPDSLDALLTARGRAMPAHPPDGWRRPCGPRTACAPTGCRGLRSGSTTPRGTSRPSTRTRPTATPPCAPTASTPRWSTSAPRTTAAPAISVPSRREPPPWSGGSGRFGRHT
ncbi:lipase [Streptomyces sp. 900105755]